MSIEQVHRFSDELQGAMDRLALCSPTLTGHTEPPGFEGISLAL